MFQGRRKDVAGWKKKVIYIVGWTIPLRMQIYIWIQNKTKIEILFILFNIIYIDAWGLYLKN